jgi:penicillin G amidase
MVIVRMRQTRFTPVMTITLPALSAPADILIDAHGIPHIRAATLLDAFVVQGWNAARDRLWQIDLWRKRGLGLLAQDFGPGYLEQDRASRLMLYRGAMAREWSQYAPDDRAICEAFVAGINAYIALCAREPERLPPEFGLMGTKPARWRASDVVRIRTHSLSRNAISEILRAIVLAKADLETDLIRRSLHPPVTPQIPDGLDPAMVPAAALDLLKLAATDVRFTPERLAAPLADAALWRKVTDLGDVLRDAEFAGSNNWAVGASLSGTGAPILASDPHRNHALPSLRYIAHLTAPGLDVIGAGEACTPGISFGHNGQLAFSGTIFYIDQEDVFILEKAPDDPDVFIEAGRRRRITTRHERVRVKGCADQQLALRFSAHGPIVHETATHAFAIRSVAQEPGTGPYLGALTGMRETSVNGYAASLHRNKTPSTNHVFADRAGNIAWRPAGLAPMRAGYDGLLARARQWQTPLGRVHGRCRNAADHQSALWLAGECQCDESAVGLGPRRKAAGLRMGRVFPPQSHRGGARRCRLSRTQGCRSLADRCGLAPGPQDDPAGTGPAAVNPGAGQGPRGVQRLEWCAGPAKRRRSAVRGVVDALPQARPCQPSGR